MNFWNWINKNDDGKRFWYTKRVLVGFLVFFVIPVLIYFIISRDPVIGIDEDGEPIKLGVYVVVALYWGGAYFVYKRHESKIRLNRLLDKLLDDKEADHLFEIAKRRRQILREDKFLIEKGENRAKWFVI